MKKLFGFGKLSKGLDRLTAVKYTFSFTVHSLAPWPHGHRAIAVGWQREWRRAPPPFFPRLFRLLPADARLAVLGAGAGVRDAAASAVACVRTRRCLSSLSVPYEAAKPPCLPEAPRTAGIRSRGPNPSCLPSRHHNAPRLMRRRRPEQARRNSQCVPCVSAWAHGRCCAHQ
eukprot:192721-Chlamydomonas_euryale.AAC.4